MQRERFVAEIHQFFSQKRWNASAFTQLIQRFGVTPEMFFYRMSELCPKFLNLNDLFFMRFRKLSFLPEIPLYLPRPST